MPRRRSRRRRKKKGKDIDEPDSFEEKKPPRAPKREREEEEGLTPTQVKKACTDAVKDLLNAKAPLGKLVRVFLSSLLLFSSCN